MSDTSFLPLRIDHKGYIKSLEGGDRALAWKQFTDAFWNSDSLGGRARNEYLFRRGFLRDKWALYALETNDAEAYLSDFQTAQIGLANGIYANVLRDRMLLIHTLSDYCAVPRIHALRGLDAEEVALTAEWATHREEGAGPALDILIQPLLAGARGRVETARVQDGGFAGFGKTGDMKLLSTVVRDWSQAARLPYLFTDQLAQGPFMQGLYAGAQNRLSVVLTRDLSNWDSLLTSATLMIGTDRTRGGVPDLAHGGLSVPIDLGTGQTGRAASVTVENTLVFQDSHPDTGAALSGLTVPHWDRIRADLLRIMDESSYMRVAMLDFTLIGADDGQLGLIGPSQLDLSGVQVHRPLLKDPVFAETMRKLVL